MSDDALSINDIANDIHFSTHCILELTTSFESTSPPVQKHYCKGITDQLSRLVEKIFNYQRDDSDKLSAALQLPFASKIFKDMQTLDMLITGLLVMVRSIEKKYNYKLFNSMAHIAYASIVIESNSLKLQKALE